MFLTLFLRNRLLLWLSILIAIIAGLSAVLNLPRLEDPRLTTRNVTILTTLPGASAQRVEALVTKKIEDKLKELVEIKKIESTSRAGTSLLAIELLDRIDSTNNEAAIAKIRDKLQEIIPDLPDSASAPFLDDMRGASAFTLVLALGQAKDSLVSLNIINRLAQELQDRLLSLPGTEIVRLYGQPEEEITIAINPQELAALGLSILDLSQIIQSSDSKNPAGSLITQGNTLYLEVHGELNSINRIANIPIIQNNTGGILRLGDIATIEKNFETPANSIGLYKNQQVVYVAARITPYAQVDKWTLQAKEILQQFNNQVDNNIKMDIVFEQSTYTKARLTNLISNLSLAVLIVFLIVVIFMGLRSGLIVGSSLPLSIALAIFSLSFFNQGIHQMSIFGLIIAMGLLIDTAIVTVSDIRQRLLQGASREQAMEQSVKYLFNPLFASTITTVLGFMPIFLLDGNVGDFIGSIATSVILAILVAFILSLTVIAALASQFTPQKQQKGWLSTGIYFESLNQGFKSILTFAFARPLFTSIIVLLMPLSGFILTKTIAMEFFPAADRDMFEIQIWLPENRSIEYSEKTIQAINNLLETIPEITTSFWLAGGSIPAVYYNQLMNKDNQSYFIQGVVTAKNAQLANFIIPQLQNSLDAQFPEIQAVVKPFGQGPPITAPIMLRIYGNSLDKLNAYGEKVRNILSTIPEVTHSQATITSGKAQLSFYAKEEYAHQVGLSLTDIANQMQLYLQGGTTGEVLEDIESLPVRLRINNENRSHFENLSSLYIIANQQWIPLSALGEFVLEPELSSITHYNGQRMNEIRAYLTMDAKPVTITAKVLKELEKLELEPGYTIAMAGDSEEQKTALTKLSVYLPILIVIMAAILILTFQSLILAAFIFIVGFLSIGLGFLALKISGYPLGFNPILGSLGLLGVAINGSIIVLTAIRSNVLAKTGQLQAIINVTLYSSRHILATTVTSVLGFLPMLYFSGGKFWPPLAVVMSGGIGLALILALLLTPSFYILVKRWRWVD